MNKLEVCVMELDEEAGDSIALGIQTAAHLNLPRRMCVLFFKKTLEALEHIDKNVFMDALELYLKEKSGK